MIVDCLNPDNPYIRLIREQGQDFRICRITESDLMVKVLKFGQFLTAPTRINKITGIIAIKIPIPFRP